MFVGGQVYEFTEFIHEGLTVRTNLFGSSFFVLTGFHGVHVTIGIMMLLSLVIMSSKGRLPQSKAQVVEIIGLYWHFVDVVWIVIFTVVYLIPGPGHPRGSHPSADPMTQTPTQTSDTIPSTHPGDGPPGSSQEDPGLATAPTRPTPSTSRLP